MWWFLRQFVRVDSFKHRRMFCEIGWRVSHVLVVESLPYLCQVFQLLPVACLLGMAWILGLVLAHFLAEQKVHHEIEALFL